MDLLLYISKQQDPIYGVYINESMYLSNIFNFGFIFNKPFYYFSIYLKLVYWIILLEKKYVYWSFELFIFDIQKYYLK